MALEAAIYRFGVFEFDSGTSELRKSGRVVALEPQPARALARLLARADDVVGRDELKDAVWGSDTHVDFDRGLAYCLSQIRSALGDSGDNPRFVQTIPKRGYRFIAPVSTVASGSSGSPGSSGSSGSSGSRLRPSAAVGLIAAVVVLVLVGSRVGGRASGRRDGTASRRCCRFRF